jgi:2-amino-4-hydroxy-6-hydroxymethyldihydropteridine diphosphokinase
LKLTILQFMNTAYLLIGGNLGNRTAYLQQAIQLIGESCGNIVHSSAIYETAAWGITDQPLFITRRWQLKQLEPEELMQQLLQIEEQMGRKRIIKMGPRIIDLDILLIDDLVISSGLLTLPHPCTTLPEICPIAFMRDSAIALYIRFCIKPSTTITGRMHR